MWLLITGAMFLPGILPAVNLPEILDNDSPGKISVEAVSNSVLQVSFESNPKFSYFSDSEENIPALTRWVAISDAGFITVAGLEVEYRDGNGKEYAAVRQTASDLAAEVVETGSASLVQGVRLIPVTINPLVKGSRAGEALVVDNLEFRIEINGGEAPLDRMSHSARQVWRDFLLNDRPPARDENGEGSGYIYVVPNDDRVRETMEDLYEWRRLQGFNIQEIVVWGGMTGDDLYQEILNENRDNPGTEYICLVGDVGGDFSVPTTLHGTSDYHYSLLSGDDPLPDAAVGRISFNSLGELSRITRKILAYERNPDIDNPDWLRRAAVSAGNPISGLSTILVSKWVRDQLLRFGFTSVDTFWYTMDGGVADFMRQAFGRGMSFINYRGWTGLEGWSARDAGRLTNRYLPVAVLLGCSTGDYQGRGAGYTEALLRAEGGAIGAVGSATLQSRVNYNNAMMAGYYRGVLDAEVSRLGWTLNYAKIQLFATYGVTGREWVISHAYWTNLMGDPATVVWRGIPQAVDVELPEFVDISEEPFEVRVTRDGGPVAGVRVGLYKEDNIATAAYTDDGGIARISYNPALLEGGEGIITVSGDLILPASQEIAFRDSPRLMIFENYFFMDDDMEPRSGNGNGIIEPQETIELTVSARNIGTEPVFAPINLTLSSEHSSIRMLQPNVQVMQNVQPDQNIFASFLVNILGNFPDREPVPMVMLAEAGNEAWNIDFTVSGWAARWEVVAIEPDVEIRPGWDVEFDIVLVNTGSLDADASEAELISLSDMAEVIGEIGDYDEMWVGDTGRAGEVYNINVAQDVDWGAKLPFELHLSTMGGISGTAPFNLPVRLAPENQPTGPDAYGYYAIDNLDNVSNISPVYNWVELNPRMGNPGTDTGLLDQGEDDDKSVVLRLPFTFRYYGREYNRLTVCTNGWAAFGDQSAYIDFRNQPIGSPQGPVSQLCPWWDDLYQPGAGGGVYYYYDRDNHRFIIEWYQMRRYVGPAGPGAVETFEIILLDPAWHRTYTGDGDIVFQYRTVTHEARIDGYSTPYSTIGIGNPEDDGGLQYGYWNQWASGAAPVDMGSAIRFATADRHVYATVNGVVRNFAGEDSLAGATVRSSTGGWVVTNETGLFEQFNVLAGLPFILTASAPGFNEVSTDEIVLQAGEASAQVFNLPHPEISLNIEEIVDTLIAGRDIQHPFQISNAGEGPLTFEISFEEAARELEFSPNAPLLDGRDDPDEMWERVFGWDASAATGDNRILGVAAVEDGFWVSGGANGDPDNQLYKFSNDGELVRRISQPVSGSWGMHDLACDNEFLYGGSRNWIYKMQLSGELVDSIPSPLAPPRALAVDPESGDIWVANDGDPVHRLDREGRIVGTFSHNLRPYGLAWLPNDPEGCPLYIFSADGETNLAVSKLHPETGDILPVAVLELEDNDRAGGCEFTLYWDSRSWTLVTVVQNIGGDRIEMFNAGPNLSWLSANPAAGEVAAEDELEVVLELAADNLDRGWYNVDMVIEHNAAGEAVRIPIELYVEPVVAGINEPTPSSFTLSDIFPNPTNSSGLIQFSLARSSVVNLSIWDSNGRLVSNLHTGKLESGNHRMTFSALDSPSGIYFVRLETESGVLSRKFVLLK